MTKTNEQLIKISNQIKNKINERFEGSGNQSIILENGQISLNYTLSPSFDQQVAYLTNSMGAPYIENTFDTFVRMKDGGVFYASKNPNPASTNIFRFGYYYHDLRIEGQNFLNGLKIKSEHILPLEVRKTNDLISCKVSPEKIVATIADTKDPYVVLGDMSLDTATYNCVQITAKTDIENSNIALFLIAGQAAGFNHRQCIGFNLNGDGEIHTYTVFLSNVVDYNGLLRGLRLDLDGGQIGKSVEIHEVKLLSAEEIGVSSLSMARVFHIYPDKLHHELQVVAHRCTEGIEAIGTVTEIRKDKVEKLAIKCADSLHYSLAEVDWTDVEAVGFDLKDAGVFGFILPALDTSGKLTVSDDGDKYTIIQERAPLNNTIFKGDSNEIGNKNDFYMGVRIYTDESHDLSAFLREASYERAPLYDVTLSVNEDKSDNGVFLGYNALRGRFEFCNDGTNFNAAYFDFPNKHFNLSFSVSGSDERLIYISATTTAQHLESAVLLDENDLLLPVPIEVGKNFSGDGDANIYNLLDEGYSESTFPICVGKEKMTYTVAQIYQNWGKYPLKQMSSIQFYAPYYHISTGVTETNCIKYRFTSDNVLPDHRAMSAPVWDSQPQHTSGGFNSFIGYTTPAAIIKATNIANTLGSYGPTYADVVMDYITTDGKIAAKYTHLEFPQTDEARTYYCFEHTFLEDIEFDDFRNQFHFYSMSDKDPAGDYQYVGYLDKDNQPAVVKAMPHKQSTVYTLGDNCPYFDIFDLIDCMGNPSQNYVNLGFIISDPEFIIGGEPASPSFAVKDCGGKMRLTLDLGKVKFTKGDSIKFNAVIMPWGSQESDYSGEKLAPDVNVKAVRENTLLCRATVSPLSSCEIIPSPFIPKVKTLNGKSAEFTLSGGENNIAVRIYGFKTLGVPSVYESIDDEWVKYELSSKDTPDKQGNAHAYDGYNVFFDEDGTYSYSFVVTMNNGKTRKFKIEA